MACIPAGSNRCPWNGQDKMHDVMHAHIHGTEPSSGRLKRNCQVCSRKGLETDECSPDFQPPAYVKKRSRQWLRFARELCTFGPPEIQSVRSYRKFLSAADAAQQHQYGTVSTVGRRSCAIGQHVRMPGQQGPDHGAQDRTTG